MFNVNQVTISGRLTRNPEQKGNGPHKFAIAWNERKKDKDGEWSDGPANFLDCIAWKHTGNSLAQHASTGDAVILCGRLQYETWEGPEGGKRSKITLVVESYAVVPKSEGRQKAERSGATRGKGAAAQEPEEDAPW